MKKLYSKKQLALMIIDANPDIFIPLESLIEDLDSIYKSRKIAKKIMNKEEFDEALLKNLIKTSVNIFSDNISVLYKTIMSEEELFALKDYISIK